MYSSVLPMWWSAWLPGWFRRSRMFCTITETKDIQVGIHSHSVWKSNLKSLISEHCNTILHMVSLFLSDFPWLVLRIYANPCTVIHLHSNEIHNTARHICMIQVHVQNIKRDVVFLDQCKKFSHKVQAQEVICFRITHKKLCKILITSAKIVSISENPQQCNFWNSILKRNFLTDFQTLWFCSFKSQGRLYTTICSSGGLAFVSILKSFLPYVALLD